MARDFVSRSELDELFGEWGRAFTKAILAILLPPGSADPAVRAARQRAEELRATDPVLAEQVAAVREARASGAFVTVGRDVGFRKGAGVHRVGGQSGDEDEGAVGPAQRAIRRRLRERDEE